MNDNVTDIDKYREKTTEKPESQDKTSADIKRTVTGHKVSVTGTPVSQEDSEDGARRPDSVQ